MRCVLEFKHTANQVSGVVHSSSDDVVACLDGKKDDQIAQTLDSDHFRVLCRVTQPPKNVHGYYGFTSFGMTLNETDGRALEEGDLDTAEVEKVRVEEAQRGRRRREEGDEWVYAGGYYVFGGTSPWMDGRICPIMLRPVISLDKTSFQDAHQQQPSIYGCHTPQKAKVTSSATPSRNAMSVVSASPKSSLSSLRVTSSKPSTPHAVSPFKRAGGIANVVVPDLVCATVRTTRPHTAHFELKVRGPQRRSITNVASDAGSLNKERTHYGSISSHHASPLAVLHRYQPPSRSPYRRAPSASASWPKSPQHSFPSRPARYQHRLYSADSALSHPGPPINGSTV
ncbi:hypothetical protein HGRIS_002980 [Hohenbuehelia grisea]|uniref:Uncharacterized protein n=1 Tax=Hohenbuehelia grisea TaxID=104357 RepID=A0ABR3JMX7_9AGAR